jgi:hypothetical protein
MEHTRETTSAAFKTEPADGTRLIVHNGDNEWEVIWRDDKYADEWYHGDAPEGDHWFRASDEDPMELHQYLKYADAVYALGAEVARFDGKEN